MIRVALPKVVSPLLNICQNNLLNTARMSSKSLYETLSVTVPHQFVYHVSLNRPEKLNALNQTMWIEIGKCFEELNDNEDCRVVVLSAAGRLFTAGLDFGDVMKLLPLVVAQDDVARRAKIFYNTLVKFQKSISSLELCRKPVLTAVHSACIGGGLNIITAADIRYCTKDAWFQLKEVDIGMAADVGALQRLPKVVGSESLVRELCYTARKLHADEALSCGLVSKIFENKEIMIEEVLKTAAVIAAKSPVAVQGTKVNLVYSRDHSVQEGLDHIAIWNQLMLQSQDFADATVAQMNKDPNVKFSKL